MSQSISFWKQEAQLMRNVNADVNPYRNSNPNDTNCTKNNPSVNHLMYPH